MGKDGKGKGCPPTVGNTVFFKNILFETTPGFLIGIFKKNGRIVDLTLWRGPDGRSRGCGTVEYGSAEQAEAAVQAVNGQVIDGRPVYVTMWQPDGREGGKDGGKASGKDHGGGKAGKSGKVTRVIFRNALFETTATFLQNLFRKFGWVATFDLHQRPDGRSLGEGTVDFQSYAEAVAAVEGLHQHPVDGRPLVVCLGDERENAGKGGGAPWQSTERNGNDHAHKGAANWKGAGLGGWKGDMPPWKGKGDDSGWKGKGGVDTHHDNPHAASCKVFFKNLLWETPAQFMHGLFRQQGDVRNFDLWTDEQGNSRGKGTVEFSSPGEAAYAIEKLNQAHVDGRVMVVEALDSGRQRLGKGMGGSPQGGSPHSGVTKVFFKNVLFETPQEFLIDLFRRHGQVMDYEFWTTAEGRPKGIGTVDFRSPEQAEAAVGALNGAEVDGRVLVVEVDHRGQKGQPSGGGQKGQPSGAVYKESARLYFKNANWETTPGFLMGKFKQYGYVVQLEVLKFPDGRSKGSGTVEYGSMQQAQAAIAGLNGMDIDGRPLYVVLDDPAKGQGAGAGAYSPHREKGKGKGRSIPY